eukprot:gene1317-539_t
MAASVKKGDAVGVAIILTIQLVLQSVLITIIFNVRDVWFLSYFPAAALTWAQLSVAALIPRGGSFMKAGTARGRIKSMQILYFYGGVFFATVAFFFQVHPGTAAFLIYVLSDVMIQMMVSIFWDICAEIFDVQQSKKMFGIINSGALFGSGLAGFYFIPTMKMLKLSKTNILYILATSMLVSIVTWFATKAFFDRKGIYLMQRRKKTQEESLENLDDVKKVPWSRRYYAITCVLEIFANLCRIIVDLLMAIRLGDMDTGSRAILLGQVSGLQSLIMVPFLLSAYWAVQWLGVLPCYGLAPISVIVFSIGTFESVPFENEMPFVAGRAFFNAINYTWFNTCRELLFLPVHRSDIDILKPYVQGRLRSLVKVAGCILCTALQAVHTSASTLTWILIGIAVLWVCLCVVAVKPYRQEFWDSLHRGKLISLDDDSMYITAQALDVVRHVLADRDGKSPISSVTYGTGLKADEDRPSVLLEQLEQHASPLAVDSRIRLVIHSLPSNLAHVFREELRDLFFRSVTQPSESAHLPLRMRILQLERDQGTTEVLFTCSELLAIASFLQVPSEVRCPSVLVVGDKKPAEKMFLNHKRRLGALMKPNNPMPLRIASAISLLKRTKMRHAAAHCHLQKVMHGDLEHLDDHAAQGLLMIGQELPEYLADGYLLYLLEVGTDTQKMVAVKICRLAHQRSSILVPHLVQCLTLGRFPSLCADALILFDQENVLSELDSVIKAPQKLRNVIDIMPVLRAIPSRESVDLILKVVLRQLKRLDIGTNNCKNNSLPCDDYSFNSADFIADETIPVGFFDVPFSEFEIFSMCLSSIQAHDLFIAQGGLTSWQQSVLDVFQEYLFRWGGRVGLMLSALTQRWPAIEQDPPLLMMQLERIGILLARLALRLAVARSGSRTSADVLLEALSGAGQENNSTGQEAVKLVMPALHYKCFLRLLNPDEHDNPLSFDADDVDSTLKSWVAEGKGAELTSAIVVDFLLRTQHWDLLNTINWPEKSMVIKDSVTSAMASRPSVRRGIRMLPKSWTVSLPKYDSDEEVERTRSTPNIGMALEESSDNGSTRSEPRNSPSTAVSMVELLSALSASFLFQSVCLQNLLNIAQGLPVVRFAVGENVIENGKHGKSLYLLLSGTVTEWYPGSQNDDEIKNVGSMFGGLACIQNAVASKDSQHYDYGETVTATSNCVFVEVGFQFLNGLFTEQNPAAVAVKRNSLEFCLEVGSYWRHGRMGRRWSVSSLPSPAAAGPSLDSLRPLYWSMLQRAVVLRTCPLFQTLKADEHSIVAKAFNAVQIEEGQTLFSQGRPADILCVVISGEISLTMPGINIEPIHLHAGGICGESTILRASASRYNYTARSPAYDYTAVATLPSTCLVITRSSLLELLSFNISFVDAAFRYLARTATARSGVEESDCGSPHPASVRSSPPQSEEFELPSNYHRTSAAVIGGLGSESSNNRAKNVRRRVAFQSEKEMQRDLERKDSGALFRPSPDDGSSLPDEFGLRQVSNSDSIVSLPMELSGPITPLNIETPHPSSPRSSVPVIPTDRSIDRSFLGGTLAPETEQLSPSARKKQL